MEEPTMKHEALEEKQPYNSPKFERYGNVRDLTQTITFTQPFHPDSIGHNSTRTR